MSPTYHDRVSIEDYRAMRHRAESAEARLDERDQWIMSLAPVAGSYRAARRAIERAVNAELEAQRKLAERGNDAANAGQDLTND